MIHDALSCGLTSIADADAWSKNKSMTHAKRFHVDTDAFTTSGKTCLTRKLLEIEWRFFGNTEDETFAEGSEDCDISSSYREKVVLTLDERT